MREKNEGIGVVKEIDRLGRIVIPKDIRKRIFIDNKVEVVITKDGVLLINPEYTIVKIENGSD